jgi:hypothetical protein
MKYVTPLILMLSACGVPVASEPHISLELAVSKALADDISGFQVAIIANAKANNLDCVAAQKSCIKNQINAAQFVPLDDRKSKGLFFPLKLVPGTPNTQDVKLKGLPIGKDFALVVEAISTNSPRLVGSSCQFIPELVVGESNMVLPSKIAILSPPANCDPRF